MNENGANDGEASVANLGATSTPIPVGVPPPIFDLAVRKTLAAGTSDVVLVGDTVTFVLDGEPLPDVDSVSDLLNTETAVDDEIQNGESDEDDHDIAVLTVRNTRPPETPLAFSGTSTVSTILFGLAVLATGIVLLGLGRRRSRSFDH